MFRRKIISWPCGPEAPWLAFMALIIMNRLLRLLLPSRAVSLPVPLYVVRWKAWCRVRLLTGHLARATLEKIIIRVPFVVVPWEQLSIPVVPMLSVLM